jgi:hypothetical protein
MLLRSSVESTMSPFQSMSLGATSSCSFEMGLTMQMVRGGLIALCVGLAPVVGVSCMASEVEHELGGKTAREVFADTSLASLAVAACSGHSDEVRRLAHAGVPVDAQGLEGMTPLIWAELCGNRDGVRALLAAGANPNGVTPSLHPVLVAINRSSPQILEVLLDHGGNPNAALPDTTWTALESAFSRALEDGDWTSYEVLLSSGADINRRYGGITIAESAAVLNVWDKVAALLERGYNRDLDRLGAIAEHADPAIMSAEQLRWRDSVRASLEQRGVRFPVPSEAMVTPPDDE